MKGLEAKSGKRLSVVFKKDAKEKLLDLFLRPIKFEF